MFNMVEGHVYRVEKDVVLVSTDSTITMATVGILITEDMERDGLMTYLTSNWAIEGKPSFHGDFNSVGSGQTFICKNLADAVTIQTQYLHDKKFLNIVTYLQTQIQVIKWYLWVQTLPSSQLSDCGTTKSRENSENLGRGSDSSGVAQLPH